MCRFQRTSGLTLAEVMIFLMLASVAVLGLVSAQIYALRTGAENEERHLAYTLLSSVMNEVLERQRENFALDCTRARATAPEDPRYQAAVTQIYTDAVQNLKKVTACLYWTDKEGDQQLSVWTYVFKN